MTTIATMAKRPTKEPELRSWAVYRIAKKRTFVGIVHNQPDEGAALKAAITEYAVPANLRDRLMAERWK